MVAFELEGQTEAIGSQALILIAGQDSCIALHQFVVIAEQPEGDAARAITCDAFHDAGPAMCGVIDERGNIHVKRDAAAGDLEVYLHLVGLIASPDAIGYRLGVDLFANPFGQLIERGWIQILAHQVLDLLVNSRAQRELVLAGDFDTLDDVAGIDVDYRGDLRGLALYQGRRAGQKHARQKQSHGADERQSDAHTVYADEIE